MPCMINRILEYFLGETASILARSELRFAWFQEGPGLGLQYLDTIHERIGVITDGDRLQYENSEMLKSLRVVIHGLYLSDVRMISCLPSLFIHSDDYMRDSCTFATLTSSFIDGTEAHMKLDFQEWPIWYGGLDLDDKHP